MIMNKYISKFKKLFSANKEYDNSKTFSVYDDATAQAICDSKLMQYHEEQKEERERIKEIVKSTVKEVLKEQSGGYTIPTTIPHDDLRLLIEKLKKVGD